MGKKKRHGGSRNREIATPACELVRNDSKRRGTAGGAPEFDVRIRISKRPNADHFNGDIQAKNTRVLLEALAVMMQRAAVLIGAPTEQVYAVVATLLFKETSSVSPDGADTFPKGKALKE